HLHHAALSVPGGNRRREIPPAKRQPGNQGRRDRRHQRRKASSDGATHTRWADTMTTAQRAAFARGANPAESMQTELRGHRWPFYVYALCDEAGRIFYVGKGQRTRIFDHACDAAAGLPGPKHDKIRELGDRLRYAVLWSCIDEDAALIAEAHIVDSLWDSGTLTNQRRETVAAVVDAIERQEANEPARMLVAAIAMLDRADEATERAAHRLVAQYPWVRAGLFQRATPPQPAH
ncbi:MAG: GIY-YIG nuclease family protein, partial [Burkholderiales bacterium]|nr:GIY-YIG nuclease family protein [Burkholderiales bacterium]